MSNGFDINTAADAANVEDEGQVVHCRDRAGDPMYYGEDKKPVTITVAGSYSSFYRKEQARQRARIGKMQRRRLTSDLGNLAEDQALYQAAACCLAWDGFFAGDKPVPCTAENARLVLERAPWIREQVEEAMHDHEGFSKTNSAS